MPQPKSPIEFSRPLKVDRVPRTGSFEVIRAEPDECLAMAERLGIPAVHSLSARLKASPWRGGGLKVEGSLSADLEQVSIVSLEPFRHQVEIPVLRYFLPGGAAGDEELDVDVIESGHIDLGEVVGETLALELDPYPRRPGEAFAEDGEGDDDPAGTPSPFAGLARLKRP